MVSSSKRRAFLKGTGASGIVALTGCLSGNSGGSNGGTAGSGSSGNVPTLEYWEYFHSQSEVASKFMKQSVKEFENNHEVKMKVNWSSWSDITGGKWLNNIQSGNRPVIYDSGSVHDGQFIKKGWVQPVSNYKDRLNDEAVKNAQKAFERAYGCYRGFEEDLYEIPVGQEMSSPFIARADHFRKAGLSIEEDFPPQDYQDLVRICKQLKQNGPAKYPFQIYGASGDVTDEAIVTWTTSNSGYQGTYLNEDWSKVNYNNETWKDALTKWVDLYRKHNFSSPKAPTTSDEGATQMLINGSISMFQGSPKDFGILRTRAPDMLKSGKIQFGPSWPGRDGSRGDFWTQCVGLMKKPSDVDEQTWSKKEDLAIDWINKMLSQDFQRQVPKALSTFPVRQDVQKNLEGSEFVGKSNFITALNTMAENVEYAWSSHPDMTPIVYDIAGPLFQQAVRGKISPDKACTKANQQIKNQIGI